MTVLYKVIPYNKILTQSIHWEDCCPSVCGCAPGDPYFTLVPLYPVAPTAGVKRSMDAMKADQSSPPDPVLMEIPSKFHKYRRLKEQQEKASVAIGDRRPGSPPGLPVAKPEILHQHGETACHSRKCAGTQT